VAFKVFLGIFGFIGLSTCGELLLGRRGKQSVQSFLEYVWVWFDDVKLPQAGEIEALYFIILFDKYFGARLFSIQRWVATGVLWSIFTLFYYIAVEAYRWSLGLPIRPPFVYPHTDTAPYFSIIFGAISLSIARFTASQSVKIFKGATLATTYFVLSAVLSYALTAIFGELFVIPALSMVIIVVKLPFVYLISGSRGIAYVTTLSGAKVPLLEFIKEDFSKTLMRAIGMARWPSNYEIIVANSFHPIKFAAWGSVSNKLSDLYLQWSLMLFAAFRLVFFVGFIFIWIVLRPLHRLLSHVFYRTIEIDSGPVTLLAAFVLFLIWVVFTIIGYIQTTI
jgi:hypothetical protein